MGAVAISTLAGATLVLNVNGQALLQDLLPFLMDFTLFFWALACWWILLLLKRQRARHKAFLTLKTILLSISFFYLYLNWVMDFTELTPCARRIIARLYVSVCS